MKFIAVLIFVQCCNWVFCIGENGILNDAENADSAGSLRRSYPEDYPKTPEYGLFGSNETVVPLLVTLDLSDDDPPNVTKNTLYIGTTESTEYIMHPNAPIVKIVDGTHIVWVGNTKTPCRNAKLVLKDENHYKHLTIFIGTGSGSHYKYFEMNGYGWRELTKEENEGIFGTRKKTEVVNKNAKPKEDSSFILDIENPDEAKIRITVGMKSGVYHRKYRDTERLVSGSKVASVVAGSFTFWEQRNGEVFKGCDEYSKGVRRLIYLRIDSFGFTKRFFFEKNGMQWKNINKDEFETLLLNMKGEENPDPSARDEDSFRRYADMEKVKTTKKPEKAGRSGNTVEMIHQSMKERDLLLAARKLVDGPTTLDVAKPDPSTTTVSGVARDGFVELNLDPIDEGFTTVKYGEYLLWTATRRGEECIGVQVRSKENVTFIRIRVMSKGRSIFFHFKNSDGDWVNILEDEFSTACLKKKTDKPMKKSEEPSGFGTSSVALSMAAMLLYTLVYF